MKKIWIVAACSVFLFFSLLTGCGKEKIGYVKQVSGGSYLEITASELHGFYNDKDVLLVAVDSPEPELVIPGTDLHVPYHEVETSFEKYFPADKKTRIVIYCTTSAFSYRAASTLAENGYVNVYELYGGSAEWSNQGYPATMYDGKTLG